MKPHSRLFLFILFLFCFTLAATAQTDPCKSKLLFYTDGSLAPQAMHHLVAANSKGQLLYYGAVHSSNPADTQFASIKSAWERFQPTVAFFEGPARGVDSTDTATIIRLGESGYVRFLAKQSDIPVRPLENPVAEYEAMVALHGEEKTELFYVLREANRLYTRKKQNSAAIAIQMTKLITQMSGMRKTPLPFTSVAAIDSAYKVYWHSGAWWNTPTQWFEPGKDDKATGGIFTNRINTSSSEFRNGVMYTLITEAVRKGEKVFVVVGKDHIPHQLPAIECSMGL